MELRHIRYFLAVAEEGNFTRAAARVGIGQPPLSQQIRDLEQEIGAALFHRVPHGAELTEAGRAFLEAVRTMPDQARAAVRSAQRAARGETGILRVGFTGSAVLNTVVPASIRAFRRSFPDVDLTLDERNSNGLVAGLRDGSLDLAFLRPGAIDGEDIQAHPFPDEPLIAALPLARAAALEDDQQEIHLASLHADPFILTPKPIGPTLFDAAVNACREVGFEPIIGQPAPQIVSVLSLVAAELGVSLVPASMRQLAVTGVAYRNLADVKPVARLALAHMRGSLPAIARNFLDLSRRQAKAATGEAADAS